MRSPGILDVASAQAEPFFARGWSAPEEIAAGVRGIIADVRDRGDAAIVEYARRWDSPLFDLGSLRIPIPMLAQAAALVPPELANALAIAKERVTRFHERQRPDRIAYDESDGTHYELLARPLASVAAYVPGGTAALPSSVIMTVVPARIAGVERIIVLTPPQRDGRVAPAVLYACALCGADELYAVGGAHGIAAGAYGTESIARVDAIVGPGNAWVTEAKRQVASVCAIDGFAGPSEVLVVADESASAALVAAELFAQAEHDRQARVAVLSQSRSLLEAVSAEIEKADSAQLPRGAIVTSVIEERCALLHAPSFDALCAAIDRFAPEHLSLRLADPEPVLGRVRNAGAVFVGEATPVACGDYLAGTNHVLPTSGSARFASGLRLANFLREYAVVRYSAQRIRSDAPAIAELAEFEGLSNHARAARLAAERQE